MIGAHHEPLQPAAHEPLRPADAEVGGYRLVRLLGAGARARVHLGHAAGHPPVAIKVFGAAVPQQDIAREAAALLRASGAHVVGLLDLAQDSRGAPALVLERLPGRSLGALLDRRGRLRPGEAVTILAPLAETVGRLHDAGVVHGGLDLGSVLFTATGAATLVGFGAAQVLNPGATGAAPAARRRELVAADLTALTKIARAVLERCDAADPDAIAALTTPPSLTGFADRLAVGVFGLADPEPVELDQDRSEVVRIPGRLATGRSAAIERPRDIAGAGPAFGGVLLDALQVPEWLRPAVSGLGPRLGRLSAGVRSVRRPLWVVGGATAAALSSALLLVPASAPTAPVPRGAVPTPGESPAATADPDGVAAGDAAEQAVLGDDPAEAAIALVHARERCFRELSVLCLDAVAQVDSSAHRADVAGVLAAQEGGTLDASAVRTAGEAELVERLGDSALVRVMPPGSDRSERGPAPVLLIKTEAGWRIRGYPDASATDDPETDGAETDGAETDGAESTG